MEVVVKIVIVDVNVVIIDQHESDNNNYFNCIELFVAIVSMIIGVLALMK